MTAISAETLPSHSVANRFTAGLLALPGAGGFKVEPI